MKPLESYLEEMKKIDGFPIGEDKDILDLSDPPRYTACPNPYINDFIAEHGKPYDEETDAYHREPYAGDVSEGKNDPVYNAHSYHTKVPHKAIMKFIEHYTDEGDIVLDGFCGTGMTGVAAQLLNRKAILSDLSPIATFIAYNYNNPADVNEFEKQAKRILGEVEKECGRMYETRHAEDADVPEGLKRIKEKNPEKKGVINYTVWSDVFVCPYCHQEYIFWEAAVDKDGGQVFNKYPCPHCMAKTEKRECKRAVVTFFDRIINQEVTQTKQVPVLINYTWNKKRYEKKPDKDDLDLIQKIEDLDIPYWYPVNKLPSGYNTEQPIRSHGTTHVHHFYTKRNLWTISKVYQLLWLLDAHIRPIMIFTFEQAILGMSKIARYVPTHYSQVNQYLSGTLYIGSQIVEVSLNYVISGKIKRLLTTFKKMKYDLTSKFCVSTQSANQQTNILSKNIDYIFTDPPFGDNLMYSELNFLWEAWLKVFTNNKSEAIINSSQNKTLTEYCQLMLAAFREYYRVLKPSRWITVVFHNSKSAVWNAIQEAMNKAGFITAHVTVLDKKQGSFKQVTAAGAVKNDLIISAYKPKSSFVQSFLTNSGLNAESEFVKQFLEKLPVRPVIERTEKMLYSKMLAYYVQHGYEVRHDSKSFYAMLREYFEESDGYWFISTQMSAYDEHRKKMKLEGIEEIRDGQSAMFISDERSALIWLEQFLDRPGTYSDIYSEFTKISNICDDTVPELKKLLEDSFVSENGKYRRPETEQEKQTVSEKREKILLREFETLLSETLTGGKKIRTVRKEALFFGFETCYKTKRFADILAIAERLDRKILENNADLSEFIEIAEIRTQGLQ